MLRQGRENVHLAKLVCVCVRVRARHKEHCDCYDHLEDWCPRFVKGVLLVNFSYHCVREQIFFYLNIPSTFSLLPSVPTCSKGKTEKKEHSFWFYLHTCFVWNCSPLLFCHLEEVHLSASLRPVPNKWPTVVSPDASSKL